MNTQAVNDNQFITKSYVDQFHQESERYRRDLGIDFFDESGDLVKIEHNRDFNDNILINIDSVVVNREPISDNKLSNKKLNIRYELDKNTIGRFTQPPTNYIKVTVGKDTHNSTKNDRKQITDTTEIKFPNIGIDLLQKWNSKCNNNNNDPKVGNFIESIITNSPTGYSGATSLPPIGNSFMYIETSSKVVITFSFV